MVLNFENMIEEINKISDFSDDFKNALIESLTDENKEKLTKLLDLYNSAEEKTYLEQIAKNNNIQKQHNQFLSSKKISLEEFLKEDFKFENYVLLAEKPKKPLLENTFFFEKKEMNDDSIVNRYSITYYTEECLEYLSERITKKLFLGTMLKNERFIIHLDVPIEYKKLCINKIINHILNYGIIYEQNLERLIEILPNYIIFKEVKEKTINTVYKECRKKYL